MSELKPCPFCKTGGLSFGNDMGRGVVQCHDCNAYIVADSEDEAITLWNTRADLPPTLSAAMDLPEVKALVKAARPFYAAVFNDNGDVTISTGHITTGDWLALDTALAALAAIKEPKT